MSTARIVVDGKPATAIYIKLDPEFTFLPGTPENHDMVKVLFDDGDMVLMQESPPRPR